MLSIRKMALSFSIVLCICLTICCIYNPVVIQNANAASTGAKIIGDLNGDNTIDALDFSLIKTYLLGIVTDLPAEDDMYAADLDGDSKITALDLSLLKQYLLGVIQSFPKKPIVQNEVIKIMPLGDSITDGMQVAGGYRIKLWKYFSDNGIKVDFVGSMSNGPSDLGDKNHEGHSGWKINEIDAKINGWMDTSKPKIVLLHIGTNDVAQNYDIANAPSRLSTLIDKICAKLPEDGKLYVAKLTPLGMADLNQKINSYNNQIPGIVEKKVTQGKPVYMVDMFAPLTTSDLADGVHPNLTGYNKMADVWFNALKNVLK